MLESKISQPILRTQKRISSECFAPNACPSKSKTDRDSSSPRLQTPPSLPALKPAPHAAVADGFSAHRAPKLLPAQRRVESWGGGIAGRWGQRCAGCCSCHQERVQALQWAPRSRCAASASAWVEERRGSGGTGWSQKVPGRRASGLGEENKKKIPWMAHLKGRVPLENGDSTQTIVTWRGWVDPPLRLPLACYWLQLWATGCHHQVLLY
jgi:hypothetical protein